MKLSANWIREFVDLAVDDRRLAEDLTNVGISIEGISGSGVDTVFEAEIGTNRPDAMNHYGVAREAAAIYDLPLKPITPTLPAAAEAAPFPITVEEPSLCPRFSARVIRGTRITASPEKIAQRLQLLDQRPISNAVDATNYVLWETGKPTHVFDMDLLEGGKIIVRKARPGETLKTLDGVERKLTTEDLVVCDAKKPVGLAGVMGGYDTMITEKTRNIVIESAWWDPITIRKASRRHALHTDASHRFERGADFESTIPSCDRVAEMILQSGGGELVGGVVDVVSKRMDQAPIVLHLKEVRRILGGNLDPGLIFRLLKRLGFSLIPEGQDEAQFRVHIPSWRLDVEREIDVVEEIARLSGYDKFENTLPAYSGAVVELPHAPIDAALRKRALAQGYNEGLSLTFISLADVEKFESDLGKSRARLAEEAQVREAVKYLVGDSDTDPVPLGASQKALELENPLSEDASAMRTSLAPGMIGMLAWNLNRDVHEARLFEMGSVYEMVNGERVESRRVCLGATLAAVKNSLPVGAVLDISKTERAAAVEAFRSFKGDVENLLTTFVGEVSYEPAAAAYLHPERSARALINGTVVAQFGQTHHHLTERSWEDRVVGVSMRCTSGNCSGRYDDLKLTACQECGGKLKKSVERKKVLVPARLAQDVFLAEFDLERLCEQGLRPVQFTPPAKYPAVERDFSFVFADDVSFEQMRNEVAAAGVAELREFRPVEIFRGGAIAAGKFSILLRVRFQSTERTLRDDEVAQWSARIVATLTSLGGIQRA